MMMKFVGSIVILTPADLPDLVTGNPIGLLLLFTYVI